jgi:hypothetical protein
MNEPFTRRAFLGRATATISGAGLRAQAADDAAKIRIGMIGLDITTTISHWWRPSPGFS